MYVVPFAITELGHKCLEPAATLKYEPLNSCITVLSIWIIKIFKCYASKLLWPLQKMTKLWRNKMLVSKCPCLTFSAAMSCLDAKISLVPSIVPHSNFHLIGSYNTHPKRQSHKDTFAHTTDIWAIFFKIAQQYKICGYSPRLRMGYPSAKTL